MAGFKSRGRAGVSREGGRTSKCLLAIGRHDGTTRATPNSGVTLAPLVFGNDGGSALGVAPRSPRDGLDKDLDLIAGGHREQPEAEQPTELLHASVVLAATTAAGGANCQPHLIASRRAIDGLQNKVEGEGEFQLADDNGGRGTVSYGHQIAAANLALHLEAKPLEEALHRRIEVCFQWCAPRSPALAMIR